MGFTAGLTTFIVPVTQCEVQAGCVRNYTDAAAVPTTASLLPRVGDQHGWLERAELPDDHHRVGAGTQSAGRRHRRAGGQPPDQPGGNDYRGYRIRLTWTDTSFNENNFQVYRSDPPSTGEPPP